MRPLEKNFWKVSGLREAKETFLFLANSDEIDQYLEILLETEELRDFVLSYLWILRDDESLQMLLKNPKVPIPFLQSFIYHGLGNYLKSGNTDYVVYFSTISKYISANQSLRLLLAEEQTSRDPALKIHLLANLDAATWEMFFSNLDSEGDGFSKIIAFFENIPMEEVQRVLFRNPTLYAYLRMIFLLLDQTEEKSKAFLNSLDKILLKIKRWEQFVKDMKESFPIEIERKLNPKDRNPNRLSILLHEIINTPVQERAVALDFLLLQEVLIDEKELEILSYGVNHYSRNAVFQVEEKG